MRALNANPAPKMAQHAEQGLSQQVSGHGSLVACRVDELRPHPSYLRHRIAISAAQLSALAALDSGALFREPLLITRNRIILDGYARWKLALRRRVMVLSCLEYDLSEEDALLWIIQRHQRILSLNDFNRILLALELEPWFRERAKTNQQLGGRTKGSSNLTEADRIDVRTEIAAAAGVSVGNVSKVKKLIQQGAPELLEALREREVSIHLASVWLKQPEKQLDQLSLHRSLRGITRTIDTLQRRHQVSGFGQETQFDLQRIGNALTAMRNERRTSVFVTEIQIPGEVMLLSTGLLKALESQGELL